MKAGTTSLYRDLVGSSKIYFPLDKEPDSLCVDDVLTGVGMQHYAALFASAPQGSLRGDASTAYSKLPDIQGVPWRARRVCGPDLKVIYIVRNPVDRIESHHYFDFLGGISGRDIGSAVRDSPRYLDYSRYGMQIAPWIETFGASQVHVIFLEEYARQRQEVLSRLGEFLGVDDLCVANGSFESKTKIHNQTGLEPLPAGFWASVSSSPLYQRTIRHGLNITTREKIRRVLFPQAPQRPSQLDSATRGLLWDELAADLAQFYAVTGLSQDWWKRDP
jgi:hypothetical protein